MFTPVHEAVLQAIPANDVGNEPGIAVVKGTGWEGSFRKLRLCFLAVAEDHVGRLVPQPRRPDDAGTTETRRVVNAVMNHQMRREIKGITRIAPPGMATCRCDSVRWGEVGTDHSCVPSSTRISAALGSAVANSITADSGARPLGSMLNRGGSANVASGTAVSILVISEWNDVLFKLVPEISSCR